MEEYLIGFAYSLSAIIVAAVIISKINGRQSFLDKRNATPLLIDSEQYYSNICDLNNGFSLRYSLLKRREQTPVSFFDGLSVDDFKKIAEKAASKIKRIEDVTVYHDGTINCDVRSNSGLSTWSFSLDFNEWGHITGEYWISQDNDDSSIPDYVGDTISRMINAHYASIGVTFPDYSYYARKAFEKTIKPNSYLEKVKEYVNRNKYKMRQVSFSNYEMLDEHMDVVIGMLKNDGFSNIAFTSIYDVDGENGFYEKQVSYVVIDGHRQFSRGDTFSKDASVKIYIHDKKSYYISQSQIRTFKGMDYEYVLEQLSSLGFKKLYTLEKQDLYIGLIKKKNSVKDIYKMDNKDELQLLTGDKQYPYDTKIVVEYHTYKHRWLPNDKKSIREMFREYFKV